jgi:ribosomal protein L25 (general stress protein Ctc)
MARSANKLTALVRTQTGKGASRRARREGKIPAVLYGHSTWSYPGTTSRRCCATPAPTPY